jgi:homoserine trans-succinylase
MEAFYRPFQEVKDEKFDGLIITGAPIEHLPFEEVTYWDELREVFDWTQTHVHSTFGVCWGGMAMIHHFHGVPKHMLPKRPSAASATATSRPPRPICAASRTIADPGQPLDRDAQDEIDAAPGLVTLLGSDEVGPCLVEDAGAPRALHLQPPRIRQRHAERGIRPRRRRRHADRRAGQLLSRRRPRDARRTAGAATRICSTATGSTRSTRPRRS